MTFPVRVRLPLNGREKLLLVLAVVGFVVPHVMGLAIVPFVAQHGFDMRGYFHLDPLAAAQLSADVSIAFVAFATWAYWEGRRHDMRSWWLVTPASAIVGFCFAVPLFLLLRERVIRRAELPGPSDQQASRLDRAAM